MDEITKEMYEDRKEEKSKDWATGNSKFEKSERWENPVKEIEKE